jgi:hypothetical protein
MITRLTELAARGKLIEILKQSSGECDHLHNVKFDTEDAAQLAERIQRLVHDLLQDKRAWQQKYSGLLDAYSRLLRVPTTLDSLQPLQERPVQPNVRPYSFTL